MNKILYFFSRIPSRFCQKVKNTILRWRGCDFSDFRDPSFGIDVGYIYRASSSHAFRSLMRYVDRNFLPFDQMSFFDAGFGKGAILIEAMKLGIPKVGGVELSKSMFESCQKNLKILGREKENTKLFQDNAATLTEQLDDFNLFYLFNPFPATVLKPFTQNIIDSAKRKPRKIFIVYYHAVLSSVIEETDFQLLYEYRMNVLFKPEDSTFHKIYGLPDRLEK
ncbi:MAG: class I SAM-dependent methyltransferase [Planctomycetaceae bacterium]|jgi:16S rRNA G966 N2-methylase RsmD|nr:class I SAM-dependent methyltransferase [Planctomycetaceae bacterium]